MSSYATEKQLNSSQSLLEKSKVQINLEETKSAGRIYCCPSFAQVLHENSLMSPLLFASSKIGIQRVYFQRWLVHICTRGKIHMPRMPVRQKIISNRGC